MHLTSVTLDPYIKHTPQAEYPNRRQVMMEEKSALVGIRTRVNGVTGHEAGARPTRA